MSAIGNIQNGRQEFLNIALPIVGVSTISYLATKIFTVINPVHAAFFTGITMLIHSIFHKYNFNMINLILSGILSYAILSSFISFTVVEAATVAAITTIALIPIMIV